MAGEKITARKSKAGGKQIIKKRVKKFQRHQSDQFMRVPVRVFHLTFFLCLQPAARLLSRVHAGSSTDCGGGSDGCSTWLWRLGAARRTG